MSSLRLHPIALAGAMATATIASRAAAVHLGDVFLAVDNGAIATGDIVSEDQIDLHVRVFKAKFGDSGFPGFTANPGFDCFAGTFQPGTKIGFDVLDALKVWNGLEFVATGGETMTISFLSLSVTTGAGPVPGFELAVQPNGGFHRHYNMFLNGVGGGEPASGVYLLERKLYSTDPAVGPSESFWFVLGHDASDAEIDAAYEYMLAKIAPAPCPGDLDGNNAIDGADLGAMLAAWGTTDAAADLNADGIVDGADLGALLSLWGAVCR
ncbi:MAG: GC-type dockerin domain-anchored protein [Phycisphaerales bacterium]